MSNIWICHWLCLFSQLSVVRLACLATFLSLLFFFLIWFQAEFFSLLSLGVSLSCLSCQLILSQAIYLHFAEPGNLPAFCWKIDASFLVPHIR